MSIEELLQQMEEYRTRKEQRDHRPKWLTRFITSVAELFDPLTDIGRVGYNCQADEHGWLVSMYLGTTEIIGGPKDGQIEHASFKIDMCRIVAQFKTLQRFEWYSIANHDSDHFNEETRSLISAHGTVGDDQFVRLELLHIPPMFVTPGLNKKSEHIGGDNKRGIT
jgi:hypothetical protein